MPEPLVIPSTPDQVARAADAFADAYAQVRDQIGRAVVGQRDVIDGVLTCLFVGGHALLEGVPGVGKTLLVRSLARSLNLAFNRVQFTPDLMPADITGTTVVFESDDAQGRRSREFRFQQGPVFTQILLADEINRATPKTQSALLEAMQERAVTVGGVTHPLPAPFLVMATQNPVEQEGTYPLPEAQLDRFMFKILVQPPTRAELGEILDRTTAAPQDDPTGVLDAERIGLFQQIIRRVAIAPYVRDYAVRLVLATNPASASPPGASLATPMVDQFVRLGASPRAAQSIVLAAKCRALLDRRPAASIDDCRAVALPALRHRLIMNFEASAEGVSADAVVSNILDTLPLEAPAR